MSLRIDVMSTRKFVSTRGFALILGCVCSAASAQTPPKALEAGLADYLAMPITGTGQLARVNFLIEEPGASRLFISDQTGTLYIVDKDTQRPVSYINLNGSAGANGLRIWICYQPNGGSITTAHPGDWIDLQAVANALTPATMTDTLAGLAAGAYTVGLCGQQASSVANNWNLEDWAYTTAQVLSGATILS